MQVPRLTKIVVNIGLGEALTNAKAIDAAVSDLTTITGQKPVVTRARRSIAQFRVRTGNAIGVKVTLRGERMWDFLERLTRIALPRIRDFRGVPSRSFDGRGNYSLGLREQLAFPEIDYDKIDRLRGLEVSIVTTATNDEESKRLLALLGMPFATLGGGRHGQEVDDRQGEAQAALRGPRLQPLFRVRPPARLHAPLRALPHLLPGARPAGRAAGRHQVELVAHEHLRPHRRHAHAHPQRQPRAPRRGLDACLAHQARHRPHPQGRGLHRGLLRDRRRARARTSRIRLKYVGRVPVVSGLKRISKPGLRVYAAKTEIPRVLGGLGVVIVSTSQGIMTGAQARKGQLGGEVLAYVW